MKRLLLLLSCSFCVLFSLAEVRLPKIFGDSMVLQRDKPIPVWGWANKNEKITITFHDKVKTIKAGKDGLWKLLLDAEPAGGPYTLIVKGVNTITLNGILTGDVWVCSGQSNMEFHVDGVTNAAEEIKHADYPFIRHFYLPKDIAGTPKEDVQNGSAWKAANPANVADFTAVGYFFARELYSQLQIPIGLIHTSWGGTDIETWISKEGFAGSETFSQSIGTLPSFNLDSLAAEQKKKFLQMVQSLQGGLPGEATVKTWKDVGVDVHAWPAMQLPGLWEQQQLKNFDGLVWFRKIIKVSAADAGKPATLKLAMIDDSDDSYVNGQLVGSTKNQYNAKRVYTIPAGLLKEGDNVIAIRVEDTGGGGGVYGDAADLNITLGSEVQSLAGSWSFQIENVSQNAMALGPNSYPSLLYNAMINPIINFAIKGAIWYQGENNAGRAYQYRQAFPLMITDWRRKWNEGDFPFYFVQLASFSANNGNSHSGSTWAELREAQSLTLSLPNTGMAVITDIGESKDIHPRNKQDVGKRLAAVALHDTYGKNIVYSGPVYQSMKAEGNKIIITFSQTGGGLMAKDKYGYVKGFEIAGADKQFYYAKAIINGNQLEVFADEVANPVAVRYSWADDAGESNLFNKEGFPAAPFRTDNWKGITEQQQYQVVH